MDGYSHVSPLIIDYTIDGYSMLLSYSLKILANDPMAMPWLLPHPMKEDPFGSGSTPTCPICAIEAMAIEIVDFSHLNMVFFHSYVSLPEDKLVFQDTTSHDMA